MLSWLDNERVTRWFAITLAPVVFICYAVGFHHVFGEFGGGDGSLPEVTSFFIVFVMCGAAYRSITERTRLQVNRERDESEAQYRLEVEAKLSRDINPPRRSAL